MTLPDHTVDAVVIGGGIVGGFAARALADSGRLVEWLEPMAGDGAASPAGGAMLSVLGEVTPGDDSESIDLRRAGAARWDDLWDVFDDVPRGKGTVVVASRRWASDERSIAAILRAAHPGEAEVLHVEDVAEVMPASGCLPDFAISLPRERWIALPAALAALRRMNPITPERVTSLIHDGNRVVGVETADARTIRTAEVVMCTGISTELLGASGLPRDLLPPLIAAKGTGVVLEHGPTAGPTQVIRTPNRAFGCGLHLVPRAAGVTYVGATNRASRSPKLLGRASADEVVQLLSDARRELMHPLSEWHVDRVVWGIRPLAVDGKPLCGRTAFPGLSVVTGTYRNGVVLAPHLADLLVRELEGGAPDPLLTPTREPVAPDLRQLLGATSVDLGELFRQPGWSERVGEMIRGLLMLGLTSDAADARAALDDLLTRYGRLEMIPEALIELVENISELDQ